MNLRKLAKGEPCLVRFPGLCSFNPETTVLAHIRMHGLSGMAFKCPDILGAYACNVCHDIYDGRRGNHIVTLPDWAREDMEGWMRRLYVEHTFYEGVHRTINRNIKRGVIET